jgi:hypothetical protein
MNSSNTKMLPMIASKLGRATWHRRDFDAGSKQHGPGAMAAKAGFFDPSNESEIQPCL